MIYLEEEIHIYYILYDLFDLEPPMLRTSHLLLHELIHSPGHLQLMVNFISWIIRLVLHILQPGMRLKLLPQVGCQQLTLLG